MPGSRSRSRSRNDSGDTSGDTSSASSGRSRSRSRSITPEEKVVLAQIFIIKIDPDTKLVVSVAPWDGTEPNIGDILLAYGVKISNNTYDAYIPIDGLVSKKLDRLEQHKSSFRSPSPNRNFDYMVGKHPSGDSFSYLYGNTNGRSPQLYGSLDRIFGSKESLEHLLLYNLMNKITRHSWRRDDFKIYVSTETNNGVGGCTYSCWYLVDGLDSSDINSPYIKEVKKSDISLSEPGSLRKKYCVLNRFLHDNTCGYCFSREIGHRNRYKRGFGEKKKRGGMGGGKSHRKLKLRFKIKTIKRRFINK
jgi:hypothetical protein